MPQSEKWQAVGRRIIEAARNELLVSLPFLDAALAALPVGEGVDTPTLATDGRRLYCNGGAMARQYERSRTLVCRAVLHLTLHCLLRHPQKRQGRDGELWDLCCDIAVESILDGLDYACLTRPTAGVRRQSQYRTLRAEMPVLTAEAIYRYFRRTGADPYTRATLTREFYADDHSLWERASRDPEQEEQWKQAASRVQTGMETVRAGQAAGGAAVLEQLRVENRDKTDYRAFLRRFAVPGEQLGVDADAFDYGYYAYGLREYGNMPLIEPPETREEHRIADLVIAIDTSMSTAGDLVRGLLSYTWAILRDTESFFHRFQLRILQCDDQIRDERVITSREALDEYMSDLTLTGQSATDFRPVFDRVNELIAAGAFHRLRGLLYFTDGLGVYPARRPKYDAAFVMLADRGYPERVPPWGIRVVLDADEIETCEIHQPSGEPL